MRRPHDPFRIVKLLCVIAALPALPALAPAQDEDPLTVQAAVENRRIYVGQPFVLQLQVQGSDAPAAPDVSALQSDFEVQQAGGASSSSQSVTIVNGRMQRVVHRGYNFNYQLTPKRAGALTIPAFTVQADSRRAQTRPLQIQALPPEENDDFKLRIELSDSRCYVGQPVVMKTTWYIGRNVDQFAFSVPVLEDDRFEALDPHTEVDPARSEDYLEIAVGDGRATAHKGRGTLDGRDFLTVSFDQVIVPRQAGALRLPGSTVSFRAVSATRRPQSLFDDFFGGSVFGTRQTYESFAVPSNRPTLQVEELPTAGRPVNFSGLIGRFGLSAEASPTNVSVGDPITLKVRISGPEFLDYVKLPDLNQQPRLAADFKIPEEMAPGEIEADAKVFTQTIRANRPGIELVPALELNYFDPESGSYESTRSAPIPIRVKGARVVTASDAEGLGALGVSQSGVESSADGIAYNYEDSDALVNQGVGFFARLGSPLLLLSLAAPPAAFLGLWAWTLAANRQQDPARRRAEEAYAQFKTRLSSIDRGAGFPGRLLEALREFLGARLNLPAGAMTFGDVASRLAARGVDDRTLHDLKELFEVGEASRYAGGALNPDQPDRLLERAATLAQQIDEALA